MSARTPTLVVLLRAAWWTLRAVRAARRQLRSGSFDSLALPAVPETPLFAERGMTSMLRRLQTTCLEQVVVRQAWYAAQGSPRDLVIGVTAPSSGFEAHAWLDGDLPDHQEGFQELLRRAPGA